MPLHEAIGRTNTLASEMRALTGLALNIRQLQQQEAANQGRQAIRAEILNKFEFERGKREKEEARLGTKFNFSAHPAILSLPQSVQEDAIDFAGGQGIIDENGMISQGDFENLIKSVETSSDLFQRFMAPVVEQKRQNFRGLFQQLQEVRAKGAPGSDKKIAALDEQMRGAYADLQVSEGNYSKAFDAMKLKEDEGKLPTKASLAFEAAGGDTQSAEALKLLEAGEGKSASTLEAARQAFVAGTATPEELALINQDKAQYVKEYLSVFTGTRAVTSAKKHANLRKQADILYGVERMKTNPLPSQVTSESAAVKYLVSIDFDEETAKELTKRIVLIERGSSAP